MVGHVGFIGLGMIGEPLAENVARAGFDLTVYDLRPEPLQRLAALGARVAGSAREVGERGGVVEIAVVDDAQVEAVLLGADGLLAGAPPSTIVAIHSTVQPATVVRLAELARPHGVAVIDVAVSGGEPGARSRTLCYMAGGDPALLEECRPVFATSGTSIFHLGELGTGAAAKLAQELITGINILAVAEALALARASRLDVDAFLAALHVSAGQSYVADRWQERVGRMNRQQGRIFAAALRAVLLHGEALGLALPGTALAQQLIPQVLGRE